MAYQPIENYGIIGNMRTVAMVGINGSMAAGPNIARERRGSCP
jgi:hypothetical protein